MVVDAVPQAVGTLILSVCCNPSKNMDLIRGGFLSLLRNFDGLRFKTSNRLSWTCLSAHLNRGIFSELVEDLTVQPHAVKATVISLLT